MVVEVEEVEEVELVKVMHGSFGSSLLARSSFCLIEHVVEVS